MTGRSSKRAILAIIREELARWRRLYRQAVYRHRVAPGVGPDRRERWHGAILALERLLERLAGRGPKDDD